MLEEVELEFEFFIAAAFIKYLLSGGDLKNVNIDPRKDSFDSEQKFGLNYDCWSATDIISICLKTANLFGQE